MKGVNNKTNNRNTNIKNSRYGNQNTTRGVKSNERNPRSKDPPKPKEPPKPKDQEKEQAKKSPSPQRKTSTGPVAVAVVANAKVVLMLYY